ncbi:hypothetical protein DR950_41740 [Kitasatospora xanthocidica]|uniref:Uncharacterized protein n=1 Tax=Kitasatospora xanthocidica TaxID=83382 RepID=A0A372ZHS8_9ACTN|nr:hypothetical protein [Kitasatospora xanthocidica]RGD55388.1 hypothetical protein DR950_41740 [Kitasatospora xanthocidica]
MKQEQAAAALAQAVQEMVDEYPMGPDHQVVMLTVGGGLGGAQADVEVPVGNAAAITELLAVERQQFQNAHPDQSGQCAHCRGTGLVGADRPDTPEQVERRLLELRHLAAAAEAEVLKRHLYGWPEPVYIIDVCKAVGARYDWEEVRSAIDAAVARHGLQSVALVEEVRPERYDEPDWHCAHHGELGNGEPACTGCAEYWGQG